MDADMTDIACGNCLHARTRTRLADGARPGLSFGKTFFRFFRLILELKNKWLHWFWQCGCCRRSF
jgi:hypothetical protein